MASQHVIILTSSKAAHDILAKQGATFSDRPHFVDLASKQLLFDLLENADRPVDCHGHMVRITASIIYSLFYGHRVRTALDASTETMMWFVVACIAEGHRGWVSKAQKYLDNVVGHRRLPGIEDWPGLPYIEAIVEELLQWRPAGAAGVPHFHHGRDQLRGFSHPGQLGRHREPLVRHTGRRRVRA
ncbi:hypothetical protein UA08_07510 [Talaromyces atroroseus]|uniref:Uncharacterized protein n=1 Tax=Talaromyces atroroseus TaxID=1441469 RepID=A0A225AGP9_TALAT|nr:hypothetical protein UA08_07510 [Talaromyces atroroseus]OKL57294.1 hypothetical protein UA08_07510 [Talaromyces atroroseus]